MANSSSNVRPAGDSSVSGASVRAGISPASTSSDGVAFRDVSYSRGYVLGLSAHLYLGVFPLIFPSPLPASPLEIIVHRTVWGLLACVTALFVLRRLGGVRAVVRTRSVMVPLALASVLIILNWTTYVYAVTVNRTIDASLGYYINPLMTVALGVLFLRERLRVLQWVAIGLAAVAVGIIVVGIGSLPWISLVLAGSFSLYSLVKKQVAGRVAPLEGMAVETAVAAPFLLLFYGFLMWDHATSFHMLSAVSGAAFLGSATVHGLLLVGSGVLTVIPLLLFASASRHLPLGVLGLVQYSSPTIQFLLGVFVFREPMEPARWVATGVIWLALLCVTADFFVESRCSAVC